MKAQLHIHLADSEGAVLRTLGLIQRRGFRLLAMHLIEALSAGGERRLELIVDGDQRPPEILQRQLLRLVDVFEVRLQSPPPKLPFTDAESPHACVGALGEFGVRRGGQI